MLRKLLVVVPILAALAVPAWAQHGSCCTPVQECTTHYVEQVKYVPHWVTECRTIHCTEYKKELRERRYVVQKCVPQVEQVEQNYTVLVPVEEVKEEKYLVKVPIVKDIEQKYTVMVPVYEDHTRQFVVKVPVCKDVPQEYTVMVPCTEVRTGVRKVCRQVPTVESRTVTKDCGHWETVCQDVCTPCHATSCCGCRACNPHCNSCTTTVCKKVWCPNIVQQEVQVTVCRTECADEQYEYQVTVCKPETRVRNLKVTEFVDEQRSETVKVCKLVPEERSRTVQVHDCVTEERTREVKLVRHVPETRTRTIQVTKNVTVAEEKCEQFEVCVPVTVEKQVEVKVCKMVAETCVVPVTKCCTKWVCSDPCRRVCY